LADEKEDAMSDRKNDCTKCLARVDGTAGRKYCGHAAFEESHSDPGKTIRTYPRTPKWCPGMITEEDQ
jgi:hypothetical protein